MELDDDRGASHTREERADLDGAHTAGDSVERDPVLADLKVALAQSIERFYQSKEADPSSVRQELHEVFQIVETPLQLQMIRAAVEYHIEQDALLGYLLNGYRDLHAMESARSQLRPEYLVVYGMTKNSYASMAEEGELPHAAQDFAWYRSETTCLIESGVSPATFKLFSHLMQHLTRLNTGAEPGLDPSIDLAFRLIELDKAEPTTDQVRLLRRFADHYLSAGRSYEISELVDYFSELVEATQEAERSEQNSRVWNYFEQAFERLATEGVPGHRFMQAVLDFLSLERPEHIMDLFLEAMVLHLREKDDRALPLIHVVCSLCSNDEVHFQLPNGYIQAVREGHVTSAEDSRRLLEKIGGLAAAGGVLNPNEHKADSSRLALENLTAQKLEIAEHDLWGRATIRKEFREHHQIWRRVMDLHHGFGALLFESRRTPSKEPALLARFGADLGRVRYVNAEDFNAFPGKGFAISDLQLDKIFLKDKLAGEIGGDPFGAYKEAWPTLAGEFEDLARAEFLFTRGMLMISCPDALGYGLPADAQNGDQSTVDWTQYSLVVFNDHFRNPFLENAFLVPTDLMREKLRGTLVGYDDFRGFEPERPDLNQRIPSPQTLTDDPSFGKMVINIGDPNTFGGIAKPTEDPRKEEKLEFTKEYKEYEREHRVYERRRMRWQLKGHNFHITSRGRKEYYALEKEATRLQALHTALVNKSAELSRPPRQRRDKAGGESTPANIAERYLNLFDLFRIAQSAWHKGHTLGSQIPQQSSPSFGSDAEDSFQDYGLPQGVNAPSSEMKVGEDESVYLNRNSLRLLQEAYGWHAARKQGKEERGFFPILAIANTLDYSSMPDTSVMLDTYDMSVSIEGHTVQLSQDAMEMEDQMFWCTTVLPKAADQDGRPRDIRFYHRSTIGLD